jgi:AGCS family alanine or glycine:cation symporter
MDIGFNDTSIKDSTFQFLGFQISTPKFIIGCILMVASGTVIIGGIQRIGKWAGKMVPLMIVVYFCSVLIIMLLHITDVPKYLWMIVTDAFSANHYHGEPALGGIVGGLIVAGVRRASFSNEAGIGTAPLALGASKSSEPIREGLVSMMSPAIDTLLVCTLTGLSILLTGVWQTTEANGVTLTTHAFESSFGIVGKYILSISAFFFAVTSLFSYSYYGNKTISFMAGVKAGRWYDYIYLLTIVLGAILSMQDVINIIDVAYALMAVPTMVSGFLLAPNVMKEAKAYFLRLEEERARERKA